MRLLRRSVSNVHTVRATRHFDQMKAGEEAVVNIEEPYWANQIAAGNLQVLEGETIPEPEVVIWPSENGHPGWEEGDPED